MAKKSVIPIVFAVDDNYAPCLGVTIASIKENASKDYKYKLYILIDKLSVANRVKLFSLSTPNFNIEFINVKEKLDTIKGKLHLRDYYTNTTYFRFFIPALFPKYSKILYLDSDLLVHGDISELYNKDIGDNYVGAIQEEVMALFKVFGDYVEQGLGVPCKDYFNAGIMLMNLKQLRAIKIEEIFVDLLSKYKFEVTQDEDYLNVICKGRTILFDLSWNKTPIENPEFKLDKINIVHFKLSHKPWHYDGVLYSEGFWDYAKMTPYYKELLSVKNNFSDEDKKNDEIVFNNLQRTAFEYTNSENNYKKSEGIE